MPYYPPAASGGSGYNLVQDEGVPLTTRTTLNFVGSGVAASDVGGVTQVSIGGASVSMSAANVTFTDGDTMRRVTITDAGVSATSKIIGMIRRPDTTDDSADRGYVYTWNVVKVASGSFDLLVSALGWGFDDPTEVPPNETVVFYYVVG